MLIMLGKRKFQVVTDSLQFILQESYKGKKGKAKGKVLWKDVGYYKDLEHLLHRLSEEKLLASEASTLSELITEITTLQKEVKAWGAKLQTKWGVSKKEAKKNASRNQE